MHPPAKLSVLRTNWVPYKMVKQHSSFWRTAFARSKSLEFFPGRISFISMISTEGKLTSANQKLEFTPSEAAAMCLHPRHTEPSSSLPRVKTSWASPTALPGLQDDVQNMKCLLF